MRRKQVWRYYCEFCKKAGCSGGHIKKHEERCTMNPVRTCGMCSFMAEVYGEDHLQPQLPDLMKLLPDPAQFKAVEHIEYAGEFVTYPGLEKAVREVYPQLKEAANQCPACIMAALRQKGIFLSMLDGLFDYKAETQSIFNDHHEQEAEKAEREYHYG